MATYFDHVEWRQLSSTNIMDVIHNNPICKAAYELAKANLSEPIFNHSVRVYLYARTLSPVESTNLFVACILHDIGCSEDLCNGHHSEHNDAQRFEVEGADAAVQFLRGHSVSETDCQDVWIAIALHTTPGIAERITPLANIVRQAVLIDFHSSATPVDSNIEERWPRLNIEKVLGDQVVQGCKSNPTKRAPANSWPGSLYRSYLQNLEWEGANKAF